MSSHGATKEIAAEGPRASKRPPNKLQYIELSEAENGGVIAMHRMTQFDGSDKKYAFGAKDGRELAAHLGEHLHHDGMSAMGKAKLEDPKEPSPGSEKDDYEE